MVAFLGDKPKHENTLRGIRRFWVAFFVHLDHMLPELLFCKGVRLTMLGVVRLHMDPMHMLPPRIGTESNDLVPTLIGDRLEGGGRQ